MRQAKRVKQLMTVSLLTVFIAILSVCIPATAAGTAGDGPVSSLDQLRGYRFGVQTGSTCGPDVNERFPDDKVEYFNSLTDLVAALRTDKVDAILADEGMARFLMSENKDLYMVPERFSDVSMAPAFPRTESGQALCEQYNEFIRKLWEDGTVGKITDIWLGEDESLRTVQDYENLPGPNGTLTLALDASLVPFAYVKDGRIVGYDVDIMARFCEAAGYRMKVNNMSFDGVLAAVQKGKCDFAACNITITPERAENVLFGEPDFHSGNVALLLKKDGQTAAAFSSVQDLNGRRIGVQTGTTFDEIVLGALPEAEISYFNSYPDMAAALEANKIDAFPGDEPVLRLMAAEDSKLALLEERLDSFEFGFVLAKTAEGEKLLEEFNSWISYMRESGELDQVITRWTDGPEEEKIVPDYSSLPAPKGVLRMVTEGAYAPMNYFRGNELTGLEIELAARFCQDNGYGLSAKAMNFDGILPAVQTGKADFAAAGVTITEERKESVLFSEPYYIGGTVMAVLKAEAAQGKARGFLDDVAESFNKTFIREGRWELFLQGVLTTLLITLLAILFGTALGFGVFMLCRNGNRAANAVTRFLMWLVQGMPMVVLLMILYYLIFGKSSISGLSVSVIGFTLTFGATVFGLLKMGVGAVENGQYEAAYALGYSNRRTFFKIILPQALPHVMPSYKGEIVSLIKATSIVGYIAVQDLTKMGDIVRSRTYEAFFPLIAITVIYFALEALIGFLISRIGINLNPKRRKREKILKGVKTDD